MHKKYARVCFLSLCLATSWVYAEEPPAPVPTAPKPQATPPATEESIKKMIEKLGSEDNIAREDAEKELLRVGIAALPLLKEATKSSSPEVSARAKRLVAKMSEQVSKPVKSYAETLPENSIFLLETPDAAKAFEHIKASPLGKLWESPAMKKFYAGHREGLADSDQTRLDTLSAIRKLLDGRAFIHIGTADSADAAEMDPPIVHLIESRQPQALEAQVRALFESIQDPCKSTRRYGPFNVEEHTTAQTVFGQESVIHALTQKAIESYLDHRLQKPAKPLDPLLTGIRSLLPNADIVLHVARRDFQALSDVAQLVDDDMIKGLDTYGIYEGSILQSAAVINENGFEEYVRLKLAPEDPAAFANPDDKAEKKTPKSTALLPLLLTMANAIPAEPAPVAADKAIALNLVPWQAGVLISFNGDISKNAPLLGQALRDIDALRTPPPAKNPNAVPPVFPELLPPVPVAPSEAGPAGNTPAGKAAAAVQAAPKAIANTPGQKALLEGGGPIAAEIKPKPTAEIKPAAEPTPAAPAAETAVTYPFITRFETIGMKFEQFLSLVDGPIHLAVFPQQVAGDEMPENVPISPLFCAVLKDSVQITQVLDSGVTGPIPHFRREVLNGGSHYIDLSGNNQTGAGFWLKGNYLAYATDRDLLDLAGQALAHQKNNERIADRAAYKQAVTTKKITSDVLLTIFAEADQMLEMPYRVAKINWTEDLENSWPDWADLKPLLTNKPVLISVKGTPEGLQAWGQTPLSIFGTVLAFRWPLKEANFIE